MRLAVIPARGGSKRIPRKNIKDFCGKPMIAWSIQAALASGCFDKVIVSTEDEEIAAVAKRWGAEIPFKRPLELSDDFTGTIPVVKHAVEMLLADGESYEEVCCIYATAPFIDSNEIARGQKLLSETTASYAFSVTSFPFPIQRAIKIETTGRVSMFEPDKFHTRSQDLEEAYHDAGQFYWGRTKAWLDSKSLFTNDSIAVLLKRHLVQDIDTPEDWERAEWMFKAMMLGESQP
ncbi:pseudaminic acid cytidylyltransferase [Pseudomonas monteilii]|uniref:pseudaminic acid cytidylyltransferase n=1 Tax=Pseudomonas monteilii TaxID=76759 RepID=UPI0018A8E013|nr:pseudaminic acid cytidylyltransferase [Pseudomonas monteilii]MBF8748650.1 pseudaminic acid cytidylyltransferase [Pseudomonas monteilii]